MSYKDITVGLGEILEELETSKPKNMLTFSCHNQIFPILETPLNSSISSIQSRYEIDKIRNAFDIK
jgi:hypothetical protein